MESQKAGKAVFKHVRIIRATVPLTAIFPDTLPHLHSPNRVVELSALKANEIKMAADIIYSCAPSEVSNVCVQAHSLKEGLVLKSYKGSSTEDRVGSIALAGNHFLLGAMQTKPFIVVWLLQKVRLPMHSYSLHFILHFSGVTYTTVLHLHHLTTATPSPGTPLPENSLFWQGGGHCLLPWWHSVCSRDQREGVHLGGEGRRNSSASSYPLTHSLG